MQFFVYLTSNGDEPMVGPSAEGMSRMMRLMKESFDSGKIVATGQMPTVVKRVTVTGAEASVTDGPFIEGKEFIPGFTVIRADSEAEALEWARGLRECMGDGTLSVALLSATGME